MLMYVYVHCAFSALFALPRTRLSEVQQPVNGIGIRGWRRRFAARNVIGTSPEIGRLHGPNYVSSTENLFLFITMGKITIAGGGHLIMAVSVVSRRQGRQGASANRSRSLRQESATPSAGIGGKLHRGDNAREVLIESAQTKWRDWMGRCKARMAGDSDSIGKIYNAGVTYLGRRIAVHDSIRASLGKL